MTEDITGDVFDRSIANFRNAIRNTALEEAAKVAESDNIYGWAVAAAIRALKVGEKDEKEE